MAQNGTGYGGDGSSDVRSRQAGKKKAALQENRLASQQQKELNAALKTLWRTAPSESLLSTIKQVMRNQIPSEWSKRRKLYEHVLEASRLIASHHAELLGDEDDQESLLAALLEFSQHADLISKHDSIPNLSDHELVKLILNVRDVATHASRRISTKPELCVIDSQEHYRQALRPLRFDLVEELKGHAFAKLGQSAAMDTRKLFQELTAYKTALPIEYGSSIFVRAVENRLDLLRAIITGPEETPYSNGIFVFDIYLGEYPAKPPNVQFLITGGGKYRFNPNLYENGKVCLSLLGTWSGPGWTPGESTLLQVLVSIQSLIFVDDPFFNEPGFEAHRGTPHGAEQSKGYNKNIRKYTLECAILPFLQQPCPFPEFADICEKHFCNKKFVLEKQLFQWYKEDKNLHRKYALALDCFDHGNAKAKATPPTQMIKTAEVNGVVEIFDDDDDDDEIVNKPVAKRAKLDDEVLLLDSCTISSKGPTEGTSQNSPIDLVGSDGDESAINENDSEKTNKHSLLKDQIILPIQSSGASANSAHRDVKCDSSCQSNTVDLT